VDIELEFERVGEVLGVARSHVVNIAGTSTVQ